MSEQGYVLNAELLKAVQVMVRQQMNSFQPRPKMLRRWRGVGAGGDASYAANLAIVTEAAEANGGVGKCVKLNVDQQPEVDLEDEDALEIAEIEFHCAHQYCGCPAGERILLFTSSVKAPATGGVGGMMALMGFFVAGLFGAPVVMGQFGHGPVGAGGDGDITYGLLTDCVVELSQRSGFAADKALEGGSGPDDIEWTGAEC